jgi:tripeptide aminopeptidase
MIDRERLAETFDALVRLDSISREEGRVAGYLKDRLIELGAEVRIDGSAERTRSDVGNLVARFPGRRTVPPLLLCAHMDTVEPGRGVVPILTDGVFSSAGDTILGADDKSGLAILLEVGRCLASGSFPHGPVEFLFTTCEEIGLLGAKHLDPGLIESRIGYALDTRRTDRIVTSAPAANRFTIDVVGKEAHAGANPEAGINAICLAAEAISRLTVGRIDEETTCNVGIIQGGTARNVVPRSVRVCGEARSHREERLEAVTQRIVGTFRKVIETAAGTSLCEGLPRMDVAVERSYDAFSIPEDHPVVQLAVEAAEARGRSLSPQSSGGGSDANVLFGKGIVMAVLGTGMKDVHTCSETVSLSDMADTADLLLGILQRHTQGALSPS